MRLGLLEYLKLISCADVEQRKKGVIYLSCCGI